MTVMKEDGYFNRNWKDLHVQVSITATYVGMVVE